MRLRYVTLTGIDESTDIAEILRLSKEFPLVEWAILFSTQKSGIVPRYPSVDWVAEFVKATQGQKINLSAHLCGHYVDQVLKEGFGWIREMFSFWGAFQRNQLNLGKRKFTITAPFLNSLGDTQVIFGGSELPRGIYSDKLVPLFDVSGGHGEYKPNNWPKPIDDVLCGYAGGLGPEEFPHQLLAIEAVVGKREIWVDMESKIRTNDLFDVKKAAQVLEWVRLESVI